MLYNVLIVEDDRRTAESLAAQVRMLGHTVAIALGPRSALQHLNEVIPDVILMDINMPGVNGLEVLRFLRRDPLTARVPVVIVTAEGSPALKHDAFAAGANAFLLKPPSLENLEKALDHVIIANPPA